MRGAPFGEATGRDRASSSLDAFHAYVGTYREIGSDELVVYYPPGYASHPANPDQTTVFERAALEAMPTLRAERATRRQR